MSTSGRLRLSDFKDLEEIGRGGFGVVFAATQPNGERVALKKICSRAAAERIKNEIRAIRCLRHPNIVQFFEDFVDGSDTYVVMELCELGSMRSYVKQNGPLTDRAAAYVLRQIISAVKYMHREGILHRDLSSGNVLINRIFSPEKISVKLCDFGLATHLRKGETACTVVGTPGYIAPQVFKQEYDQAADVYSLGGVLYTMLTGGDPPTKGPMRFDGLSLSAVDLIESMMEQEASKRISLNATGDRVGSVLSQERRRSREYSRERRSGFDRIHDNSRGDESRPRRAASNPPLVGGRLRLTTGGAEDSGFGSRSCGEKRIAARSGARNLLHTTTAKEKENGDPAWPLPIYRCGGARLVTAAGRYVIVDDHKLVFEVANKNGFITKIVEVLIGTRGRQQVAFGKPAHSNVGLPLEHDGLIPLARERNTVALTSFSSMNRHERDVYAQIANAVEAMRGRVDKIVYQRPAQFPSAVAKIMENGTFRIVFRDQRRLIQKRGSKEVQMHYPDGKKEDVLDSDTLRLFEEVFRFLKKVEDVWEHQIGSFPLSFSISKDSVVSPRASALSENRVPLSEKNFQSSLLTQRSAPATISMYKKTSIESSKGCHDRMRFKINKNNEVCSVESPDGRYLRVSSVSKSKLIFRARPDAAEQRFHVTDPAYPKGARELYGCLEAEIRRREMLS